MINALSPCVRSGLVNTCSASGRESVLCFVGLPVNNIAIAFYKEGFNCRRGVKNMLDADKEVQRKAVEK